MCLSAASSITWASIKINTFREKNKQFTPNCLVYLYPPMQFLKQKSQLLDPWSTDHVRLCACPHLLSWEWTGSWPGCREPTRWLRWLRSSLRTCWPPLGTCRCSSYIGFSCCRTSLIPGNRSKRQACMMKGEMCEIMRLPMMRVYKSHGGNKTIFIGQHSASLCSCHTKLILTPTFLELWLTEINTTALFSCPLLPALYMLASCVHLSLYTPECWQLILMLKWSLILTPLINGKTANMRWASWVRWLKLTQAFKWKKSIWIHILLCTWH